MDHIQFFTEQWALEAEQRSRTSSYATMPVPYCLRLAFEEEYEEKRVELERWLRLIADEKRNDVVSRLKDPRLFWDQYFELMIGDDISQFGASVEFSPNIIGKTPDWSLLGPDGEILAIVEVTVIHVDDGMQGLAMRERDLLTRVEKIELGYLLHCDRAEGNDSAESISTANERKGIARLVSQWLHSNPCLNHCVEIGGYNWTILSKTEYSSVSTMGWMTTAWAEGERPEEKINEKSKKYARIVKELAVPYIVALVPESGTAHDGSTIAEIIFGDDHAPGLFDTMSTTNTLSGIIVYTPYGQTQRRSRSLYANPNATLPLPAGLSEISQTD